MNEQKVKASDHDGYNVYTLVAFLIPLVGFIMGAIMMTKDDKLDRKLGEHTIVTAVFGCIVAVFLWLLFIMKAAL